MIDAFDYETVVMGKSTSNGFDPQKLIRRDVRLQRLFEIKPLCSGKILDIGCGGGTITECLAHMYPSVQAHGTDVSSAAIALAKKNKQTKSVFRVIENGRFPYNNNFFDFCVCFDVLEHVPDIEQFMKETKRVLKPGGSVFFAIPCEGQPWSLTWMLQKINIGSNLTRVHVGHIHPEFTHSYIYALFKKYGFAITSVSYSEHFITQCVRFIRFILPKELMDRVLGKRAENYYDRSMVASIKPKQSVLLLGVRQWWLAIGRIFDVIENIDAKIGKNQPFTAWKVLLLAQDEKIPS